MAFDREARPARPARGNKRRKVCQFCAEKCESIDYKDAAKLRRFVSERSKILPRRTTGTCAMHQRQLTEAIKRARQIAARLLLQNQKPGVEKLPVFLMRTRPAILKKTYPKIRKTYQKDMKRRETAFYLTFS